MPIEAGPADARNPNVAIAANGNALAVWEQFLGTGTSIWASRYIAGFGWTAAEEIESAFGDAFQPIVAADFGGNATVVWTQLGQGGANASVWVNRYAPGAGWGAARLLADGNASAPDVGIDAGGNATVVWAQWDGASYEVFTSRFIPLSGWGTPEPISPKGATEPPAVAVDPEGNAVAVWAHFPDVYANAYTPGRGWGTAAAIDNLSDTAEATDVASGNGIAVAVWQQNFSAWASRLVPSSGWETAVRIGTGIRPKVAVGGDGSAVAAWQRDLPTGLALFTNRYVPGAGWGTEVRIDNRSGAVWNPHVVVDGQGNAVVVWQEGDGLRDNLHANRYVVGAGWSGPEFVETNLASVDKPHLAMDGSGNVIAVWQEYDSLSVNIWANQYVVPDTLPPTLIISSPQDGTTTDKPTIMVSGSTEQGVTLVVSGFVVSVAQNGTFAVDVPLRPGTNTIRVTATDSAGNQATATVTVVFTDPFPGLERDLREALEELQREREAISLLRVQVLTGIASAAVVLAILEIIRYRQALRRDAEPGPVRVEPPKSKDD